LHWDGKAPALCLGDLSLLSHPALFADWNAEEEDTTAVQQWEDDWDDDDVGDDFSKHLRAELEKGEGQKQS
jgi:hypothetical protein